MSNLEKTKMEMDILKIVSDMKKTKQEYQWYPFVMGIGVFGAAIAFVKLFLN